MKKACLAGFICGAVLWAVCAEGLAQLLAVPPDLRTAFSSLLGDDSEAQQSAFEEIAAAKKAVLVPALEAYSAGLLERRANGQLVIYQSRVEIRGKTLYPLVDAFTLESITNRDGSPVYADRLSDNMLRPDASARQLLGTLISELSIYHPDPDRRSAAIVDAANRNDPELLEELKAQLAADEDGTFTRVLTESIARMELVHGDARARASATETLAELGSSRWVGELRRALERAQSNGDAALAGNIEGALSRIESYQQKVRLAQHTFAGLSLGSILILLALGLSIIFGPHGRDQPGARRVHDGGCLHDLCRQ